MSLSSTAIGKAGSSDHREVRLLLHLQGADESVAGRPENSRAVGGQGKPGGNGKPKHASAWISGCQFRGE